MLRGLVSVIPILIGLVLALSLLGRPPQGVEASDSSWSEPKLLFSSPDEAFQPNLSIDQEGGVHAFWHVVRAPKTSSGSTKDQLFYTQLRDSRWSSPTDVFDGSATDPMSVVDQFGVIHLFWAGPNDYLFNSDAAVGRAALASAWTSPSSRIAVNQAGEIAADQRGNLYLVYPRAGVSGLFYSVSNDGGNSWSFPVTISRAGSSASANYTRVAVGPDGTIHVVWTEFQLPDGWPPLGVYYAHSTDGGVSWSNPVQIAGPGFTQGNVAAGPNGVVHVAWNGMSGVHGRYHRWSSDGGNTWSDADILKTPDVGGSEGPPQMVIDSAGALHILTTDGGRVWYGVWNNEGWSPLEYIPTGDEEGIPPIGTNVDPKVRVIEEPSMVLGLGNRLSVIFIEKRNQERMYYAWYTTKLIDAPAILPVQFKTEPTSAGDLPKETEGTSSILTRTTEASFSSGKESTLPSAPPPDSRLSTVVGILISTVVVGVLVVLNIRKVRTR